MKFSERRGVSPPQMPLEPEGMPSTLRNRLWTVVRARIGMWSELDTFDGELRPSRQVYELWDGHYRESSDTLPSAMNEVLDLLRAKFLKSTWHEIYDLLEFIAGLDSRTRPRKQSFPQVVNQVLEEELAAWRFIGLQLQQVTGSDEMASITEATESTVDGVRLHIRAALQCLAQRPDPDTRNAIKEAVSAVESAARSVTGRDSAVYSALAQRLAADGAHPQFVQAWKNLYSYTSDAGGVRHGAKDGEEIPSVDEAKLFVITASAFTNYLVAHYATAFADGKR
ncbi:MAG: hypothetical protein EVA89_09175 [Sandaracinaceae bacterium]|nr:MAG: hypothetical protein EVA89_09175 [Sandaracinaceae bacterium]